jgi:vacuolar-type H+-ATPase subunit I/STV1
MTTTQTSEELKAQIAQLDREVADINRSLDRLTRLEDLLGARSELTDRAEVISLLQTRLEAALAREAEQERLDRRQELERQRDEAREQFDRLTERFENALGPLIDQINTTLDDTLRPLGLDRDTESSSHSTACFELRGRTTDWSGANDLSTGFGFFDKLPRENQDVRAALFELYKARIGAGGSSFAGVAPRTPQFHDNAFQDALDAETNRYFGSSES